MQRSSEPSKDLQTFPNPAPENDYTIRITVPEFTCLCPLTGQPDFANFIIEYVPDESCVELKSLKMYFWSFREEGGFHEKLSNEIFFDKISLIHQCIKDSRTETQWHIIRHFRYSRMHCQETNTGNGHGATQPPNRPMMSSLSAPEAMD